MPRAPAWLLLFKLLLAVGSIFMFIIRRTLSSNPRGAARRRLRTYLAAACPIGEQSDSHEEVYVHALPNRSRISITIHSKTAQIIIIGAALPFSDTINAIMHGVLIIILLINRYVSTIAFLSWTTVVIDLISNVNRQIDK